MLLGGGLAFSSPSSPSSSSSSSSPPSSCCSSSPVHTHNEAFLVLRRKYFTKFIQYTSGHDIVCINTFSFLLLFFFFSFSLLVLSLRHDVISLCPKNFTCAAESECVHNREQLNLAKSTPDDGIFHSPSMFTQNFFTVPTYLHSITTFLEYHHIIIVGLS